MSKEQVAAWEYPTLYDVIVVGGGHAGYEAAHASARMGCSTLLLTINLDTIGKMSCNPAVGGIGKGHMVLEIDALGGLMGRLTECAAIQTRMLNRASGPAVWAPRAQTDKAHYQLETKRQLEATDHLHIQQGTVEALVCDHGRVVGVTTKESVFYRARAIVISSGTFLRGLLHAGQVQYEGGRAGDLPAVGLSASLAACGLRLGRLKTGTPPRVHRRSIDYSLTEEQPTELGVRFSFGAPPQAPLPHIPCHITYTTGETKRVIQENLHRSALYSGRIKGVGPRYCPSIEDKVVRFADKERHQLFLEPEGLCTEEIYVNGISSSMPFDVQLAFLKTIPALRHAEVMRFAYAIEYDYVLAGQISEILQTHAVEGLFLAGQINGTTGYEEAAAQGLVAGINAACQVQGKPPFVLKRSEAYIGVMIDDLVTKEELNEPYRMFTSRAEYRLLLRQDNADLRLRHYGHALGLVEESAYTKLERKRQILRRESERLLKQFVVWEGKNSSLSQLLCRPEITYARLAEAFSCQLPRYDADIEQQIELHFKYAGYIARQETEVAKWAHLEAIVIPKDFSYGHVSGLCIEAQQKLQERRPTTVAQASRLAGVSPADISVLMVALQRKSSDETFSACTSH